VLTIFGRSSSYCDGLDRRSFLRIGGLGFLAGSFGLTHLLRAQAAGVAPRAGAHKAVINIFLAGGPPHLDMWDLKPEAPKEIRGEFSPIATNVPGIQIGECFPRLARVMDKCIIVRSVVGSFGHHWSHQCLTGWDHQSLANLGGRPSIGAALSKIYGPVDVAVPPFVGLCARTAHQPWSDPGTAGFLGKAHAPFQPDGPGLANMRLKGITLDELEDRKKLRASLDGVKRAAEAGGMLESVDHITQRAFDVLTSSRLLNALDLSKEEPRVRERYGDGKPYKFQYDGAPTANDQLLMARRLIEAGVRCVTLSFGRWDSHGDNFNLVRDHGGKLDQALSALIEDLDQRGMLNDVAIACWGEFGRTPRVNPQAGRDHWPQVSGALLAGGGLRTGQVVGATNRLGEVAKERPVEFQEIVATLYHCLGVDTSATTLTDPTGRPQYLVDAQPMKEVI
jgi:hypothetical protein